MKSRSSKFERIAEEFDIFKLTYLFLLYLHLISFVISTRNYRGHFFLKNFKFNQLKKLFLKGIVIESYMHT